MENQSLANRTLVVEKNNYKQTVDFLKEIPTVVDVVWIDQTSSSGDWSGAVVEKINDEYQVCEFWQKVDYFGETGKSIHFGGVVIKSSEPFEKEDIKEMLNENYCDYDCYDDQEFEIEEDTESDEDVEIIKKPNYEQQQIDFG